MIICKYLFKRPCHDPNDTEAELPKYRECTCEDNPERLEKECVNPLNAGGICPYYKA